MWESVEGTIDALKIAHFQAGHRANDRQPYRTAWSWRASGNAGFQKHLLLHLLPPSADKKHAAEAPQGLRLLSRPGDHVGLPMWWCSHQTCMKYMPCHELQSLELRHKCRFSDLRERSHLTSSSPEMRPIAASKFRWDMNELTLCPFSSLLRQLIDSKCTCTTITVRKHSLKLKKIKHQIPSDF